jgi:hypothetical protein
MSAVLAILALLATPAGPKPAAWSTPALSFTRAEVAKASTADLAKLLLRPEVAAAIVGHEVEAPVYPADPLRVIRFKLAPIPVGGDICRQDSHDVYFTPTLAEDRLARWPDTPTRAAWTSLVTRITLAPDCRLVDGQRFASFSSILSLDQAIGVLRSLVAARAAAAAPGPLPFTLTCSSNEREDRCGGDARAALASLPIVEGFGIGGSAYRKGVYVVRLGNPDGIDRDEPYWEVELRHMGSKEAAIEMAWTPRTLE